MNFRNISRSVTPLYLCTPYLGFLLSKTENSLLESQFAIASLGGFFEILCTSYESVNERVHLPTFGELCDWKKHAALGHKSLCEEGKNNTLHYDPKLQACSLAVET